MDGADRIELSVELQSLRDAEPAPEVLERIVRGANEDAPSPRLAWPLRLAVAFALAVAVLLPGLLGRLPGSRFPALGPHESGATAHVLSLGAHQAELAPNTEVDLVEARPGAVAIRLRQGRVTSTVEELEPGEYFRVETARLRAVVVGTRFSVGTEGECELVQVEEGRVLVEREGTSTSLETGEEGRFCPAEESTPEPESSTIADEPSPATGRAWVRDAIRAMKAGNDTVARDHLERYLQHFSEGLFAEEALFHLAAIAGRQGDLRRAETLATRLSERFPSSPRIGRLEVLLERLRQK